MPNNQMHSSKLYVEFNLLNPLLIIHQHDLVWWINYTKQLKLYDSLERNSTEFSNNDKNSFAFQQFADDFTRDFSNDQIENVLKQQNNDIILSSLKNKTQKKLSLNLYVQCGLTDFECQLKNVDGAAIFFGIELATFVGNNVCICCYFILKIYFRQLSNLSLALNRYGVIVLLNLTPILNLIFHVIVGELLLQLAVV